MELGDLGEFLRAKAPVRLPGVLTVEEVQCLLAALAGTCQIMGRLLYGTGMRLMELIRLRVKDVDFGQNQIIVRDGKGANYAKVVVMQRYSAETCKKRVPRVLNLT
jgi:integrase